MITFYGSPMSSAGRTHWMFEEVGVPYDYKIINTRAEQHKTPEFLAVNPTGKIPAIVDGDIKLGESMAINFYLAEKYAPSMMPTDLAERAKVYEWSFWAITNVQPVLLRIMMQMFAPEDQRDAKVIESAKAELPRFFEVLDKALAGREFLVAGRFTVADVNVGSVINLAVFQNIDIGQHAKAWIDRLKVRPAYQRAAAGG